MDPGALNLHHANEGIALVNAEVEEIRRELAEYNREAVLISNLKHVCVVCGIRVGEQTTQ